MRTIFFLVLAVLAFYFVSLDNSPSAQSSPFNISAAGIVPVSKAAGKPVKGLLTRLNFEDSVRNLYDMIGLESYDLDYKVFRLGMVGYYSLQKEGALNKDLITIIDFAKPSTEKRFYTIDLKNMALRYHTYVAHGRNTGENMATSFSNIPHSNQSSLGFYVTGETYVGSKGYSLRLDGKEKSFNDRIRSRAVVIHAADYATETWIKRYGRLGRSQGCPALPPDVSREMIDTIKDKTAIFTYYPDENYLNASRYLKVEDLFDKLDEQLAQRGVEATNI
jgi:hypothetical protein